MTDTATPTFAEALGPQGQQVCDLLGRIASLTPEEGVAFANAVWDADDDQELVALKAEVAKSIVSLGGPSDHTHTRNTARAAARAAGEAAVRSAAADAPRGAIAWAVQEAMWAIDGLLFRNVAEAEDCDMLTRVTYSALGSAHPDGAATA